MAQVIWNRDHDACVIAWSYRPSDYPLDAINFAMSKFYNQGLRPYLYEAYDGDLPKGMLLADSMELQDEEIYALFDQIRLAHDQVPQTGEWEAQEFHV